MHPLIARTTPVVAMQLMPPAPVAKLVDALDLGSSNASCVGSSPIRRTNEYLVEFQQDTNFLYLQCNYCNSITNLGKSRKKRLLL